MTDTWSMYILDCSERHMHPQFEDSGKLRQMTNIRRIFDFLTPNIPSKLSPVLDGHDIFLNKGHCCTNITMGFSIYTPKMSTEWYKLRDMEREMIFIAWAPLKPRTFPYSTISFARYHSAATEAKSCGRWFRREFLSFKNRRPNSHGLHWLPSHKGDLYLLHIVTFYSFTNSQESFQVRSVLPRLRCRSAMQ